MKKVQTWKDFWDRVGTSRDPIAATDRPTVSSEIYQLYSTEIVQKLALRKDDILLDIACGTGIIDANLTAHAQKVFAVDYSEVMSRRTKAQTGPCGNAYVATCDCTALPFKDGSFSKAVAYALAQYLSQTQMDKMIGEAQRVLQPGGLVMLGEIPRARDTDLLSRIRDVWAHQGIASVLRKTRDKLFEHWLRVVGIWTGRYVRPAEPPITLHSEEELLRLVCQHNMYGQVLPQSKKLPWFHQTFDVLIKNAPRRCQGEADSNYFPTKSK